MLPPNHFNKQILAQWLLYLDSKGISQELEYIIDNVSIINLQGKGNRKKKGGKSNKVSWKGGIWGNKGVAITEIDLLDTLNGNSFVLKSN